MKAEIKTIDVNGITLAYKEYGTGDNYLLSTQNFFFEDCHMALLGQEPYNYHTFLVYMRGYNKSTHIFDETPRDYTSVWGQDLLDFADAMGIDKFYYTGISHGNWAGWYIAFNHPERLKAFVCVDGIAQFRSPDKEHKRPVPPQSVDFSKFVGNRNALAKMAWMEYWPTDNPQRLARRAKNNLEHIDILMERNEEEFKVFNNNMSATNAKTKEEFEKQVAGITVPILFWSGGLDPLSRTETVLQMNKLVRGSRMLVYNELGHGGADEMPELCARDCDRYFKDIQGYIV